MFKLQGRLFAFSFRANVYGEVMNLSFLSLSLSTKGKYITAEGVVKFW